MFDSLGKLSEGILRGHLNMVGQYDECMGVQAYIPKGTFLGNRTTETSTTFGTRFCRLTVKIPERIVNLVRKTFLSVIIEEVVFLLK